MSTDEYDLIVLGGGPVGENVADRAVQGGLTCGRDTGLTVSDAYKRPFAFTGTIRTVSVKLDEEMKGDPNANVSGWPPPISR